MIEATRPGAGTLRTQGPWAWFALLAACAALLVLRRPDGLLNPQFWAEDGRDFFGDAYREGAAAIWKPYAGYFHLLPRLIAWACDSLAPLGWVPALYAIAAVVVTLAVVAVVLDPRLPLAGRPALALAIVLVPQLGSEVALTIANLQWLTALALLATLCKHAPAPGTDARSWRRQTLLDVGVVLLCGLTGPFSALFLPLFALRVVLQWRGCASAERSHALLLLGVLALVALIQAAAVMQRIHEIGRPAVFDWGVLAQVLGGRVVQQLFVPGFAPAAAAMLGASAAALVWLVLLAWLAWLLRQRPALLVLLLGAHLLVSATTLYRMMAFWPEMRLPPHSSRYFVIPHTITLWVLIDAAVRAVAARAWGRAALLALLPGAALVASLAGGFTEPARADLRWPEHARHIGRETLVIPIHPPPWTLQLPAR